MEAVKVLRYEKKEDVRLLLIGEGRQRRNLEHPLSPLKLEVSPMW